MNSVALCKRRCTLFENPGAPDVQNQALSVHSTFDTDVTTDGTHGTGPTGTVPRIRCYRGCRMASENGALVWWKNGELAMTKTLSIGLALACLLGVGCSLQSDETDTELMDDDHHADWTVVVQPPSVIDGGASVGELPLCGYDLECVAMTTPTCKIGHCRNGTCTQDAAQDGTFCVPSPGANPGVCFAGLCVDDILCDDGNHCTDDFVDPTGVCVGVTVYVYARSCPLGMNGNDGICMNGACKCNSDDDCDDGDPSTPDSCFEAECLH
jgi:hypothetical protein